MVPSRIGRWCPTQPREGLVGNPLQSVIEGIAPSRDEPSRHGWVSGVSRDVHMGLAAPKPELTVWSTMVGKLGRCNPLQRNHLSTSRVA
jgi:hypothetical protein